MITVLLRYKKAAPTMWWNSDRTRFECSPPL